MALGDPVCFRPDLYDIASLGVDCHSATSADIPGQMRLALQSARGTRNQNVLDGGKTPSTIRNEVEHAYNLGTIKGARAVGMASEIGSLAEGKLADIVIFDALSPGMVCATEQDPIAAVVLHSSIRDIDTVIVDGIIRKEGGRLLPSPVDGKTEEVLEWKYVASKLINSREKIEEKVQEIDYGKARKAIIKAFYIQEDTLATE
jgi:cytosine/adenosine deaminase-related metal-dependent hydrolase